MKQKTISDIITALNENNVRYMIAGGLAVVFYGYVRFTSDIDLIIELEKKNLERAVDVFDKFGYVPRVPVNLSDLTDEDKRQKWIEEKGMMVFSLFHPEHIETTIDIFIKIPFDFNTEYEKIEKGEITPGVKANFISYDQLIKLKETSSRDIDKIDIVNLKNSK